MPDYIAELDDEQNIVAVWFKDSTARGPKVFDPDKHVFEAGSASGYFGAPQEKIAAWIAGVQRQRRNPRK